TARFKGPLETSNNVNKTHKCDYAMKMFNQYGSNYSSNLSPTPFGRWEGKNFINTREMLFAICLLDKRSSYGCGRKLI
ncbi:13193_t:CDS:2, partial [Funneliformis caledonium]